MCVEKKIELQYRPCLSLCFLHRYTIVSLDDTGTDYGNYTCEASNVLGSSSCEIELSGKCVFGYF